MRRFLVRQGGVSTVAITRANARPNYFRTAQPGRSTAQEKKIKKENIPLPDSCTTDTRHEEYPPAFVVLPLPPVFVVVWFLFSSLPGHII